MKQVKSFGIQGLLDDIFKISDKLATIKNEADKHGISISIYGVESKTGKSPPGSYHQVKFNSLCDMNLYQLIGTVKPEQLIEFVCDEND